MLTVYEDNRKIANKKHGKHDKNARLRQKFFMRTGLTLHSIKILYVFQKLKLVFSCIVVYLE